MIGKTLSRYRILAKLGEGGMGEVYLAEDTELGREVALKVLPPVAEGSPERLERFRREARAVASLNHPNIVTLFNVEEAEGRRLLVMERVEGQSLDRLIPPGGMPLAEVFAYAIPMADALAAAHEKGITHRDLKPANVMVTVEGQVKVLDFGLAKLAADSGSIPVEDAATEAPTRSAALTGEGTVMGTAPYMSPEQLKGREVDSRSDIFSFGILLYEMVTGRRPFQGDSGIELASSILKDTPSSVVETRGELPRHLGRIIQHCLEKDPERRYQSAKDVRNELEGLRSEVDSGQLTSSAGAPPRAGVVAEGAQVAPSGPTSPVSGDSHAVSGPSTPIGGENSVASGQISAVLDPNATSRTPWGWIAAAGMLVAVVVLAVLWWQGRASNRGVTDEDASTVAAESSAGELGVESATRTVAVLPFVNLGADESLDYLRLAVPDEIATSLSRGSGLAIRPFSTTSRLDVATRDPLEIGRELGVANVITGQYFKEGDQLSLTLEAIDVAGNKVIWRDSAVVGSDELLSLRQEVAASVGEDLMPLLDPTAATASMGTLPSNEEAYDLYLRSLQMSTDPGPNSEALGLLERAVELDPNYAPIWGELARRRHMVALYGGGTDTDNDRAIEAARRAIELDSELLEPQARIAMINVERGNLVEAFEAADRLVAQRPRVGRAYFLRAYVLRYAGSLEESVRDCETALGLDGNNPSFRSCGISNSLAGNFARAEQFFHLSPDNDFYYGNLALSLLRQGRVEEALDLGRNASYTILATALEPFVAGRPMAPEVLQREIAVTEQSNDAEQLYWDGAIYAFVGEHETGLRFLREAIDRGYCSYPFMNTDPLLADLRSDPELAEGWAAVVAAGKVCHESFLSETSE